MTRTLAHRPIASLTGDRDLNVCAPKRSTSLKLKRRFRKAPHCGAPRLSAVRIDSYNVEIRSSRKFVGDSASGRAFRAILEHGRELVRKVEADPLGNVESA